MTATHDKRGRSFNSLSVYEPLKDILVPPDSLFHFRPEMQVRLSFHDQLLVEVYPLRQSYIRPEQAQRTRDDDPVGA